jgi:hypothetical protein
MLLGIDVLLHLRDRADTVDGIAGALLTSAAEVERVLGALRGTDLVGVATAGYGAGPDVASYTITAKGTETMGRILDHYSTSVVSGPPQMTVGERFLFALASGCPGAQANAILQLLDSLPPEGDDTYRRKHALELARVTVSYAIRALAADERGGAAAEGLKSIRFANEEDAKYLAEQLRESYAPSAERDDLRAVVELAADVCDASDELRVLTRGGENRTPGVSEVRDVNEEAYNAVAELTAETMKAAVAPLGISLYDDAEAIVKKLPPPPPGAVSPA